MSIRRKGPGAATSPCGGSQPTLFAGGHGCAGEGGDSVVLAQIPCSPAQEGQSAGNEQGGDEDQKGGHGLLLRHGRLKLGNTAKPRPGLLQLTAGRFGRLAYPPAQKVTGLLPRVEVAEARTKAGALNHAGLPHHCKRSHLALKLRHIHPHMRGVRHPSLYRLDAVAKGQEDTHGLLLRGLFRLLLYGRRGQLGPDAVPVVRTQFLPSYRPTRGTPDGDAVLRRGLTTVEAMPPLTHLVSVQPELSGERGNRRSAVL